MVPRVYKGEINKKLKLFFIGAYSKEGLGAETILISPEGTILPFSHKLEFDATNNVAEYEALALRLEKQGEWGSRMLTSKETQS